jgi:hypothetical protein
MQLSFSPLNSMRSSPGTSLDIVWKQVGLRIDTNGCTEGLGGGEQFKSLNEEQLDFSSPVHVEN